VTGIELDAEEAELAREHAERVVVADLDGYDPGELQDIEGFDVITFGDVLEHLRDPEAVLRSFARLLHRDGYVVVSLPNVAHVDVRLSLLRGRFEYGPWGLLDRTHLRFFTLSSLRQLLRSAGLVIVETRRVVVPLGGSELGVDAASFPPEVLEIAMDDPEAETYQFVVKAVLEGAATAVAGALERLEEMEDGRHAVEVERALAEAESHRLRAELHNVETELRDVRIEARSTFANLAGELERHRAEQERARAHIASLEEQLRRLHVDGGGAGGGPAGASAAGAARSTARKARSAVQRWARGVLGGRAR
jgi:SAM-dependent methyltransferase